MSYPARPVMDRIKDRVLINIDGGCWEWQGPVSQAGYAKIATRKGVFRFVHRVTYEEVVGPIPDGLQLDHLCRVRHCCNPLHLEPVTCRENLRRTGVDRGAINGNRAKTQCKRGHPLSGDNLYINPKGERQCRACGRLRQKAYKERARA